jgi:hypothetical protein
MLHITRLSGKFQYITWYFFILYADVAYNIINMVLFILHADVAYNIIII